MNHWDMKPFAGSLWKHFAKTLRSPKKRGMTFIVNLAVLLDQKQHSGFMALQHRQSCARGMQHHADVTTEQAFSAVASCFTKLCSDPAQRGLTCALCTLTHLPHPG